MPRQSDSPRRCALWNSNQTGIRLRRKNKSLSLETVVITQRMFTKSEVSLLVGTATQLNSVPSEEAIFLFS